MNFGVGCSSVQVLPLRKALPSNCKMTLIFSVTKHNCSDELNSLSHLKTIKHPVKLLYCTTFLLYLVRKDEETST